MARQKGSARLAASLEVLAGAPLDARTVVNTKADLTDPTSFQYVYQGMLVAVKSENKVYILTALDFTDTENWKDITGSGELSVDWDDITNKPEFINTVMTEDEIDEIVDEAADAAYEEFFGEDEP